MHIVEEAKSSSSNTGKWLPGINYGDSALLVLNGTSLNSVNALLVLS